MSAKSKTSNETTEEVEEEVNEDEEEEENREVEDGRVWWIGKKVSEMLRFALPSLTPSLTWPQHPDLDHHHIPLKKYLDEAQEGSLLLFWHPDADDEEQAEGGGGIDWDEQAVGAPFSSAAGTTTFSWKFDDADQDDDDEEHEPKLEVETYVQVMGDGPRLQVLEGGFSPDVIGQASVLVKKVVQGSVPLITNTLEASVQMPNYLHMTFFHRQTHFVMHEMFDSLYLPLCEKLGKSDRTGYLASLSKTFSRISNLKEPDPPLDYDSEEDETKKRPSKVASSRDADAEEGGKGGNGEQKEGKEEEEEDAGRSLEVLFLKNVNRMKAKFSQEVKEPTLGDLRQSWTDNYLDLSASLAFVKAHPVINSNAELDSEMVAEAKGSVETLSGLHTGYSDCYRSLFYLEKFFRVVGEGRLEALAGHADGLLEVLEFIWRLGKKDGISGKVQIILESAVQSLVELVTQELRPVNLLPSNMREPVPLLNSQSRVKSALAIVEEWESVITRYGESINQSAKRQRDGRQDFDPCRVLGTIASVRSICDDLDEIMKVLLEAQTGFSGEWSALIRVRDPDQLKNITSQVLKVLTAYDFNIFSPRNYDRWVRQKDDFQLAVQKWEQAVINAIHESFKDRLTSELVTAVAGVLGKQPCRAVFRELLISRLPDLLSAFATEVKGIRADFQAQQKIERPGTQAPLSGRVRWMATYLTKRLAAWTTLKDLYSQYQGSSAGGELWAEVGAEVEEVQHEVEGARAKMVTGWSERVTQQIPKLLVTPVLSRNPNHKGPGGWQVQLPGELQWIVWESGQLLQTGIKPPELAVHLTLHYQTLQTAAMSLHLTLNDYHAVLAELSQVQRELLSAELSGAERVLAAGQRVVTWSPAALTHFSASCKDVIEHVRALANKLMSITHRLEDYLATIQRTNLLEVTPGGASPKQTPSLMELMEVCSNRRDEALEILEETYDKLVTTLGSAGLLLDSAEEGAPEQLAIHIRAAPDLKLRLGPFLEHWKHNVKEAIILMMVGSIRGFEEWLNGEAVLFGVEANLTLTGALTLSPAPNTLATTLADALGQTVRCAMSFRHWAELDDGTAALDPAPTADDDTLAATTFYSQISTDPRLHDSVDRVQTTFAKVIHKLDKDLQKWYAYEHVWKRDKVVTVTRFCSRGPSVKQYDDKLRFYTHLSTELAQATGQLTHGCVNLNVGGLVKQVVEHIDEWMKLLGKGLLQEARSRMQHVLHQITTINSALQKSPDDLTALTVVMKGVGQVSSEQAHLHTALLDVSQMFHTLQVYGIKVPKRDYEQLDDTSARLEVLHQTAATVQKAVEPVQQLFLSSTQNKIDEFSSTVRDFHRRFEDQGPGSVGENLERGVELLKEYSAEVEELLKIRRALEEEEEIFDLAATQYPGLDNAIHVMKQMKGVFAIYQKLRTIETTWRTMRWPTAKLDELKHQVEGIQRDLAECEGSQDTEVGRSLHQRLQDHANSLEVTAALRQPAVQPRHWQRLIASAGCKADWVGGRSMSGVSVWDVLELRLSRHPLLVATTVAMAIKENILNNHLTNITHCWQHARLTVVTTSPLWYVDGLDGLLQHLHHHNLALKTLRSTKYCRPFEDEASRLAKTLVRIEELLEAWKSTQSRVVLLLSAAVSSLLDTSVLKVKHRQLIERTERRPMILELSANGSYVQEVSSLRREADLLLCRLSQSLSKPRRQCSRLYLLTDQEMTRLLAEPSCKLLSELSYKLFNNVVAMKWIDTYVTGVVSVEGEQLDLPTAVNIAQLEPNAQPDAGGVGVGVGAKVQRIIEGLNLAMRKAMKSSVDELGREIRLFRSILQEQPVAAVTVAWRVWWAAGVDVALQKRAKGNRETLRQVLENVNEDLLFLLEAMGRGAPIEGEGEEEEVDDQDYEGTAPLSSVRTSSRLSTRTARRPQPPALPPERGLSLLMACIHARDVVAALIRNNTSRTDAFSWICHLRYSWQNSHSSLLLHAAHCHIEYGYEYSGCGNRDYVLTPGTERYILALINAITAHTPPLLVGKSGCGRQSLLETAAHLAARFITSFTMSKLTSANTLKILLTGTVIGGWWTVFRDCTAATPTVLSALASTLLAIHQAHSHTTSTPVIQIAGEEVSLHPSAGIILIAEQFPSGDNDGKTNLNSIVNANKVFVNGWKLPHSMETLTRPIRVTPPPINTLIFAWLQASAIPRAQEVGDVVAEVLRQVMESYRTDVVGSLRVYMRLTQQVMSTLSALQSNSTPVEAAAAAFRKVMVPLVPKKSVPAVDSVLDLLKPEDDDGDSGAEVEKESDKLLKETILRQLSLRHIPSQMETINTLVNDLDDWGCVVVVGPPRSGKSSVISVATRFLLQRESEPRTSDGYPQSPSDAPRSSLTEGRSNTPMESQTKGPGGGVEVDFLQTDRELADRFVFALRPRSYSTSRFYGNSEGDGLFSSLLQHLAWKRCRSFVVLEGRESAECLLRMRDLPGTLVLESLKTLQPNGNVTFIIEVCSTEEVPEWVLGRSAIVQISPDTLTSSALLPSSDLVPMTPSTSSTGRLSRTSQTPRTASKPNTPIPEDPERLSPGKIREYILHRLLQPVLEMLKAGAVLHCISAVDVLEQVNFLSRSDVNERGQNGPGGNGSGEAKLRLNDQLGSFPLLVQAALQVSRAISSATQLPKLQEEIGGALKKLGSDGILSSADKEVVQSLSSCGGAAFDQSWDLVSSSWSPWLLVGEDEVDASVMPEVGYEVAPTRDARRLSWLIGKMSQIYRPMVLVGGPGSGKTTTALQALSSLTDWRKIRVDVTCTTTAGDLEDEILRQVTRKSFDTLIPSAPTIFLLDDLGCLPRNSQAFSFLQGIVLHKGLYVAKDNNKWMNLSNVYIVGVSSYYGDKWAYVEGVEKFSGWAIYNMDFNEDACTFYVSSALTPISSLQSQVVSTMVSMTEAVAQRLSTNFSRRKEPFIPPNKQVLKWHVAAALRRVFHSQQAVSSSEMSGALILNIWLHSVTSEFLFNLHSQRRKDKAWHEIQCCVAEEGMDIVGAVPSNPPVPLWPPGMEDGQGASLLPKYVNAEEAAKQIAECLRAGGVTDTSRGHAGIGMGITVIVDALRSLVMPLGTHTAPFLLLVGPLTRDKDVTLFLAANYMGMTLKACDSASEVTSVLGAPAQESEVYESSSAVQKMESSDDIPALVLVPASLLRDRDVCRAVLNASRDSGSKKERIIVVSGCKEEIWRLTFELRSVSGHGRVVCLPAQTLEQHYTFVKDRIAQVDVIKKESRRIQEEIADFVAQLHLSYCTEEEVSSKSRRKRMSSPDITRGMTSIPPRFNRMPPVTSMSELIDVFGGLLSQGKDQAVSALSDLEKAVSRVADLESHVRGLRETHSGLETSISEAEVNIKDISEKLEEKEASIVDLENTVCELRGEVATVERSYEELRGEVAEYIEETKAPLVEITAELSQLDMQRIRKLLSRAPLSAIQVLFECSVFLLGATDMSMKAVKHATHDNTFCKKLAAVCVPGLNATQISTLNEKLEQIKMTNDHMARVSDIGGVLLTYMRTLIFYWHRHHEDIQPRQARVEALKDSSKQLQVEIATKERLIRGLKEDITSLNATTKEEEGKMISLKGRKMDVEEELERVLAVINELRPHAERWQEAIEKQKLLLEQVTGKALLKAACLVYLTDLTPIERQDLTEKWEKDLVGRGLLKQTSDKTDGLKLVSKPGDLQKDVQAFVDHYAASLKCLLLRDPHHVVEEYLSGGIWISTETDRWKEEVQDRLDNGEKRLIYLGAPHSRALDLVKWSEAYLGKDIAECRGEITKETRKAKIIVIMDGECSAFYCPLCSTHTILDVTLDYKGAVHQFLRAILKWHLPRLEEQVQASVRSVAEAQAGKGKAEENLIKTFINSKKVTDMTELESFTSLVRVLNEAMEKGIETERQLEGLTSQVSEKYLRASKYITRLYQVTHLVSPLNSGYSVPITLLLENLAHKVSKLSVCVGEDSSKETDMEQQLKELDEAMTASVIELLDTRLQLQHRVTVSTCFALAKLDMENVREDYVTSFLTPLDKGRDIWWRPKKIKKEATLKEDEKCAGDGDEVGEEEGEEKADGEEEVVDDAKEEEGEGDEKEDAEKEEEEEEEIEAEDSEEEQEQDEEFGLDWMPKECDAKTKRVFERLTSRCSSLFPLPVVGEESVEDVRCQLLKWIRSEDDAPSPSTLFCVDDDLRKASQEVLLARHLRPDLMISAMKNLVGMALPPSTLPEQNSGLLSRALTQHWRPKMTPRTGISDLIQIHVGGGTQPLHDLLTAAKKAGLPYYKLTFLSMATASQQELRRRVVMAARRKTWLVLLDCEVLPDSLWSIHAALKLLPSTLSAPTVICLLAKGLYTVEEINSSVVVQLEIPNTLSSNLAAHLQFGYDHLQAHVGASGSNPGQTQAAILATAYIFSLLQTRRIYGKNSWVSRPLLTQAIFKESLSAAHHLTEAFKGKVTWETLAALLAKVTYGSVVTAALDQHIIDRIFADHLNDKSYFLPVKQMKVHRQASVVETPTPDGTTEQPGLGGPAGDEADRVLSPVPTITTPELLGTSGGPHQQPLEAQGNILLYSFLERKLVLDLKLPPQQAIERVCEVAEISEAQLVGLSEQYRHLQSHQELTTSLEVFTATPLVSVPKHAVMRMLKELQGRLPGPLGPRAAQVVKEEDLETLAWQREVEIWDEMQGKMSHQLLQIEEALSSGCARPAQALLALSDIVRESVLDPDNCVTSKGDLKKGDVRQAAAKDNLVTLWIARTITKDVLFLSEEWEARHHHLLCWAESELAPAVVHLGMMEMPGWWLTRLRQAVCTKAHWLLQGSLVYAVPWKPGDDEDDEERPKQGAYVSGGNLVGGRWYKDKVYPDAPNEPNLPMTFAVTVSHAMKPTPVGCAWVPVLEKRRAEKPLFLALLPLHSSLSSKRSPLHVILH